MVHALDNIYGIVLPNQAIYVAGLILELIALAVLQVIRSWQPTVQPTTT